MDAIGRLDVEKSAVGKVMRRLVSCIFLLFILSSIDRVNVSFAALQMNSQVASVSVGGNMLLSYAFLIIGLVGLTAAQAVYWTIPMGFMGGVAAAGGFALINLVGNSAGLIGPNLIGWVRSSTGTFSAVGYLLGGFLLFGAACLLPLRGGVARVPTRTLESRA